MQTSIYDTDPLYDLYDDYDSKGNKNEHKEKEAKSDVGKADDLELD